MQKLGIWLVMITCTALAIFWWNHRKTVCERTLVYRVGDFDERFGISETAFRAAIQQAENVWEDRMGVNLFEYDPTAQLVINLVFDERQQVTFAKQDLVRELKQTETSHTNVSQSYNYWFDAYNNKRQSYEDILSDYEDRLRAYNAKVQYWNNHNGAPKDIYIALEEEREKLHQIKIRLDEEHTYLNEIVEMLNSLEDQGSMLVDSYNSRAATYSSLYGERTRFHKGEYNGKAITIYQFHDTADLILVLAHELGHALRLGHVANPKAVMHTLMGAQDLTSLSLTHDDIDALKTVCGRDA